MSALLTAAGVEVEVGDWVVAGETAEDREAGEVLRIEGGRALIGWVQGAQTWDDCSDADVYTDRATALGAAEVGGALSEYVSIVGIEQIGSGTMDDLVEACRVMEGWMTDHEGDELSVSVRPPRRGEVTGLYRVRGGIPSGTDLTSGDLGDETGSVDRVRALLDEAWEAYCQGDLGVAS